MRRALSVLLAAALAAALLALATFGFLVERNLPGHVGSPHRLDQLPFWRDGDPSGLATRLSRPARETAVLTP